MSRQIRIQFPGAVYHVTARGNQGNIIFNDDSDRQIFLMLLAQMARQYGVTIHTYCLMPNHYHLVVETPRGNLSQSIGWLQVTYTVRFNRRHKRYGHLFQGRFKALLIEADRYAYTVTLYIHLNPVRPKEKTDILPMEKMHILDSYPWSSHQSYAGIIKEPKWLDMSWLQYWGDKKLSAQKVYRESIGRMFNKPVERVWDNVQHGIVLGGENLTRQVQQIIKDKKGEEEEKWMVKKKHSDMKNEVARLLESEKDKRIQIWVRVRIAGEHLVDVGKDFGYKDGSGVLKTVKRLEEKAKQDQETRKRLSQIESYFLSSVKS
jgi:putative transposase